MTLSPTPQEPLHADIIIEHSLIKSIQITVTEHENHMDNRIKKFVDETSYSDWIVLSFFHTNLTTVNFKNFLEDLVYEKQSKKQL